MAPAGNPRRAAIRVLPQSARVRWSASR